MKISWFDFYRDEFGVTKINGREIKRDIVDPDKIDNTLFNTILVVQSVSLIDVGKRIRKYIGIGGNPRCSFNEWLDWAGGVFEFRPTSSYSLKLEINKNIELDTQNLFDLKRDLSFITLREHMLLGLKKFKESGNFDYFKSPVVCAGSIYRDRKNFKSIDTNFLFPIVYFDQHYNTVIWDSGGQPAYHDCEHDKPSLIIHIVELEKLKEHFTRKVQYVRYD